MQQLNFNIVEPVKKRTLPNDPSLFNYKYKNTAGAVRPSISAMKYRSFYYQNYEDPVKFTEENIQVILYGLLMDKNNIFFKLFRKKLQQLFESGITNIIPGKSYFDQRETVESTYEVHEEKLQKVKLSLNHLKGGFVIWLISLTLTILIFFMEIIYSFFKKTWKTLRR